MRDQRRQRDRRFRAQRLAQFDFCRAQQAGGRENTQHNLHEYNYVAQSSSGSVCLLASAGIVLLWHIPKHVNYFRNAHQGENPQPD